MELIPPSSKYGKSYLSAFNEMRDELNDFKTFWEEIGSPENIEDYIQLRLDHAKGLRLPKDWIPASTYWLIDGDEVIGETNIRHQLTDHLRNVGGQIGYWIRPAKRGQGHGKEILRLGIQKARELGIGDIIITCDKTNDASRRIIESNGGVFERAQKMGEGVPDKLLFWIRG